MTSFLLLYTLHSTPSFPSLRYFRQVAPCRRYDERGRSGFNAVGYPVRHILDLLHRTVLITMPNNHSDISRKKIVIRPRYKGAADKRRDADQKLSCFASSENSSSVQPSSASGNGLSTLPKEIKKDTALLEDRLGEPKIKVSLECIEELLVLGVPARLVVDTAGVNPVPQTTTRHECTCLDPQLCPRCRMLALADRYILKFLHRREEIDDWT